MKYHKNLIIYSIKNDIVTDNLNTVIKFLVNKYEYLLKTLYDTNVQDSDSFKEVSVVSDIVSNKLFCNLFPYIARNYSKPDFETNIEEIIQKLFHKYIIEISIDLFNKKQNISRNINFNETDLITKFKNIFSMYDYCWNIPIKNFLIKYGRLLGKLSSYVYDCQWVGFTSNHKMNMLVSKQDKLLKKITLDFISFFYGNKTNIVDKYELLLNYPEHNYSKLYSIYYELSKYIESDDVIMIIISKSND